MSLEDFESIDERIADILILSHEEMCRLWRFAPSGHPYFKSGTVLCEAFKKRFDELGGMTPEMSKRIGFEE